jgi:vancomycin resistance protein YoaR
MPRNYLSALAIMVALLFVATGIALGIRFLLVTDEIVAGVSVGDIDVGGLNTAEAQVALRETAKRTDDTELELGLGDKKTLVRLRDIGIETDLEQTIAAAVAVGRSGRVWRQLQQRQKIKTDGKIIPLEFRVDEERLAGFITQLAEDVKQPARDAYFILGPGHKLEPIPAQIGQVLETDRAKEEIMAAVAAGQYAIRLPVRQLMPRTVEELLRMGVKEVVGIFSTSFNVAAKDRNHNIKLAAAALNGHLIESGQLFSFNEAVGPRDLQQGYKEALIITDDKLVPGVGGGICQVSSTLYNAVLLSGLEVVERHNHTLPIDYISLGRDATLAYGTIDLRFKNSRPEPVMICSGVSGNQLTVAILGTGKGEQVEIRTDVEEEIPFPVVFEENPDLVPGADTVMEEGKVGYKVTVTRTIRKNGEIILHEVVARDIYQPQPELHVVGPVKEEFEHRKEGA